MKKIFMVLLAVCFFTVPAMAFDHKDAGFTKEGVFYVADELIQKAGYGAPTLQSSLTGWRKDVVMELKGDYWVVSTGKKAFGAVEYCFQLGYSNMWLPHVLVDQEYFEPIEGKFNKNIHKENVVQLNYGEDGYNFKGKSVPVAPF